MPWKECKPMDERLRFVARLLEGEKMARVCREFGISRVTGYKIFSRYKDAGYQGLLDRSRRPYRHANRLPFQLERAIVGLRKEHPSWGAAKIRAKILRSFPMVCPPAKSTVHAVLDRNGLSSDASADVIKPRELRSVTPQVPTRCGVLTSRASSCSATASTVTR